MSPKERIGHGRMYVLVLSHMYLLKAPPSWRWLATKADYDYVDIVIDSHFSV